MLSARRRAARYAVASPRVLRRSVEPLLSDDHAAIANDVERLQSGIWCFLQSVDQAHKLRLVVGRAAPCVRHAGKPDDARVMRVEVKACQHGPSTAWAWVSARSIVEEEQPDGPRDQRAQTRRTRDRWCLQQDRNECRQQTNARGVSRVEVAHQVRQRPDGVVQCCVDDRPHYGRRGVRLMAKPSASSLDRVKGDCC